MIAELVPISQPTMPKTKRLIALEKFLELYTNRETPYKYEWNNGIVEKTERTMNRDQFPLLRKLLRLFETTKAHAEGGILTTEVDMFLPKTRRTRRADIVFVSAELMEKAADNEPTVCPFVIEIVSKNDQINENDTKLIEYFQNGIEVVWFIIPKLQKVEVYTSIRDVKLCYAEDICSAAPVLPDFQISVNDLFS
jgi:Uma2 family endonuclease